MNVIDQEKGTEKKEKFTVEYRVAFADTDSSGIVHFSNYFRFFERAEEAYLLQLGLRYVDFATKFKIWLPRIHASCDYVSPCRDGDIIQITLMLKSLKKKTITEYFEVRNKTTGKIAARGELVNVAASLDISKSVPIPTRFTKLLRKGK